MKGGEEPRGRGRQKEGQMRGPGGLRAVCLRNSGGGEG